MPSYKKAHPSKLDVLRSRYPGIDVRCALCKCFKAESRGADYGTCKKTPEARQTRFGVCLGFSPAFERRASRGAQVPMHWRASPAVVPIDQRVREARERESAARRAAEREAEGRPVVIWDVLPSEE